jgi:protein arginine kinase activator
VNGGARREAEVAAEQGEPANCRECGAPAELRITTLTESGEKVVHLCGGCAARAEAAMESPSTAAALLGLKKPGPAILPGELVRRECPDCGIKFMDFRNKGRLGCPNDYIVFRLGLIPLLERVHRGVRHTGKRPVRAPGSLEEAAGLRRLRRELRDAINSERFEEAAHARDRLRAEERRHGH